MLVLFLVGLWFLVVLLVFALEDTWLFALTSSPTCGNWLTKTTRFDDRLSLERARHGQKKKADTFCSAADTAGKQKWALILPSSARVSELTYVTIVGARYPELDTIQNDIIQFGNYLQGEQSTRGGFLPIFWDAPDSYIQEVTNEGNKNLAVLHNRNKMVNAFATTEWVAGSDGS